MKKRRNEEQTKMKNKEKKKIKIITERKIKKKTKVTEEKPMKPKFVSLKINISKIETDLSRHTKKGKCIKIRIEKKNQDRKRRLTSSLKEIKRIIRPYHW